MRQACSVDIQRRQDLRPHELLQEVVLERGCIRQARKCAQGVGVELLQARQDLVAQEVAAVAPVIVARIAAEIQLMRGAISQQLRARKSKQGPAELDIGVIWQGREAAHARQAAAAAAANDAHEQGLCLVVGVVARGDQPAARLPRGPRQKVITRAPCRRLQPAAPFPGQRRHIGMARPEWQLPAPRQLSHEVKIALPGRAANAMIERGDNKPHRQLVAQGEQDMQQSH